MAKIAAVTLQDGDRFVTDYYGHDRKFTVVGKVHISPDSVIVPVKGSQGEIWLGRNEMVKAAQAALFRLRAERDSDS